MFVSWQKISRFTGVSLQYSLWYPNLKAIDCLSTNIKCAQSNPVNTDSEGSIESVHSKWVMLLKSKNTLLLEQNTKVTEEDISIVKLNIFNFHKLKLSFR